MIPGEVVNLTSETICPAYAGMIPKDKYFPMIYKHLSRVCGDDPHNFFDFGNHSIFVPRMRG